MGALDILLRVKGDSSDAVKAMDDTTAAARRTEHATERTARQLKNLLTVVSVSSVVSAIGDIRSAVENLFAGVNYLTGNAADRRRADEQAVLAANAPDLAGAIEQQAESRARGGRLFGINIAPGQRPIAERRAKALRNQLLERDPAIVRAVAPYLDDQATVNEVLATLAAREAGTKYVQSLTPSTTRDRVPVVQNMINVNTGVGDPNRIGREVKAATDARDRNNGYTRTTTRRR